MRILWKYLKPFRGWLALNPGKRGEAELIRGALYWLGIAIAIGLGGRVAQGK